MSNNQLKNLLTRGMLPVALSAIVAVSASAVAELPGVPSPIEVKKEAFLAQKTKPAAPASKPAKEAAAGDTTKGDKAAEKPSPAEIEASIAAAQKVEPLALLKEPEKYVNKQVTFVGTFNRFADIGLDYKKAFRDSRDYVTFFILRPDVTAHTIPLSEMKLFFPRKKSEEVMDLESGDKIQVVGKQFSAVLNEPWIDVEHIKILEKTKQPERKTEVPEF